jgi:hypothetical protein
VDDALVVRRLERVGDLACDGEGFFERRRSESQPRREGFAFDELEDEEPGPARFFEAVDASHVRMIQRGENLRFTLEPRDSIGVGQRQVRERLDRHVAPEPRVAGAIHLAHSARADRREHVVRSDASARG